MKGVFKCAMENDERRSWSVKRSSLGIPMCTPKKYSRRLKRLSLGMPPCIPFFINNHQFVPRCTIFITSCVMCCSWSVSLFNFPRLFLLCLLVTTMSEPTTLDWERYTLHFKLQHLIG